MTRAGTVLIWAAVGIAVALPLAGAVASPLLAWRDPIYIAGGLAGVAGLCLLLLQPLLAGGWLPGLSLARSRRLHRLIGGGLVVAVLAHVAGLWLTSPPDVIDALLFASPAPFSAWGVVAMWALLAAAVMAAVRRRLPLSPSGWRLGHTALAGVAVLGTVTHAMLIEGAMQTASKAALCLLVLLATAVALARVWTRRGRSGTG